MDLGALLQWSRGVVCASVGSGDRVGWLKQQWTWSRRCSLAMEWTEPILERARETRVVMKAGNGGGRLGDSGLDGRRSRCYV